MPDLIIAVPQTPPTKSPGPASSSQAEASGRNEEASKANTGQESSPSFASTLKSQMDKKSSSNATEKPTNKSEDTVEQTAETTGVAESATITAEDVATLLPLIEAALAGMTPGQKSNDTTTPPGSPDTDTLAAVIGNKEESLTITAAAAPGGAQQASPPPKIVDQGGQKASAGNTARAVDVSGASEKLAVETAIAAETTAGGKDMQQHDQGASIQSRDFQSVLDRASMMNQGGTSSLNGTSTPAVLVKTPLGQAGWHEEIGQKLTWMVGNNRQQADIVLTPPQLGRIEVSLTMNGDQATATFSSANPAVREALENSLQRLRESLADAGVTLGQTQVGAESFRQSSQQENGDNRLFSGNDGTNPADASGLATIPPPPRSIMGLGMVDVFA